MDVVVGTKVVAGKDLKKNFTFPVIKMICQRFLFALSMLSLLELLK